MSPKQTLPVMVLYDPVHGWQACPKLNSFHQGGCQTCPREKLFSSRTPSQLGGKFRTPPPPAYSFNDFYIKFRNVRGTLRPDRESGRGEVEGQVHGRPQQHRSISARSGTRLRFFTDANARAGKRGVVGGEAGIKVLGACGRDVLNDNGTASYCCWVSQKTIKLASSDHFFFLHPQKKKRVLHLSKVPTAARDKHVWTTSCMTKNADHRLVRCVNVRRFPLEAPKSDHNIVVRKISHST